MSGPFLTAPHSWGFTMHVAGSSKRLSILIATLAGLMQAACLGSSPPIWEAADLKAPDGILGRFEAVETLGAETNIVQIDVSLEDDTYVATRFEKTEGVWAKDSEDVFRIVHMGGNRYLAIDYAEESVFYSFLFSDQPGPGQFTLRQLEMSPDPRENAAYLAFIKQRYDLDIDVDQEINTVVMNGTLDIAKLKALFTDPQFMAGVWETNTWVLKARISAP